MSKYGCKLPTKGSQVRSRDIRSKIQTWNPWVVCKKSCPGNKGLPHAACARGLGQGQVLSSWAAKWQIPLPSPIPTISSITADLLSEPDRDTFHDSRKNGNVQLHCIHRGNSTNHNKQTWRYNAQPPMIKTIAVKADMQGQQLWNHPWHSAGRSTVLVSHNHAVRRQSAGTTGPIRVRKGTDEGVLE